MIDGREVERHAAVERWLRTEVVAAYDEHNADPSKAVPADQAMARLRARVAARQAASKE